MPRNYGAKVVESVKDVRVMKAARVDVESRPSVSSVVGHTVVLPPPAAFTVHRQRQCGASNSPAPLNIYGLERKGSTRAAASPTHALPSPFLILKRAPFRHFVLICLRGQD